MPPLTFPRRGYPHLLQFLLPRHNAIFHRNLHLPAAVFPQTQTRSHSHARRRPPPPTSDMTDQTGPAQKFTITTASNAELSRLTRDGLVYRIRALEKELSRITSVATSSGVSIPPRCTTPPPDEQEVANTKKKAKKEKKEKKSNNGGSSVPKPRSTRHVALKLAYLGKQYGGFEFQNSCTATAIEEMLWKALVTSHLIVPRDPGRMDWLPFQYAKCGRTDKGVSAFGQVISIRLRSNKPVPEPAPETQPDGDEGVGEDGQPPPEAQKDTSPHCSGHEWDPIKDEIDYPRVLNRLLPNDIRVLSWCPTTPEDFDARFSCRERQYRYFFTQPAFAPIPSTIETTELHIPTKPKPNPRKRQRPASPKSTPAGPPPGPIKRYKEGWLDIDAMREAASYFVGSHDFRNFCRIDGARQINQYRREMFEVTVDEVKDAGASVPYVTRSEFAPGGVTNVGGGGPYPKAYVLCVNGNAFLWHQIRCMISVLFMVGQGLEKPTVIKELLDVENNPRKPHYTMADEVPLVLWDCLFPTEESGPRKDGMQWVYSSDMDIRGEHGFTGMFNHLWTQWRERKMDEMLANRLLDMYTERNTMVRSRDDPDVVAERHRIEKTARVYDGGNCGRAVGAYTPMMQRPVQPSFEEVNDAFARKKGFKDSEDLGSEGNWLASLRAKKKADDAAAAAAAASAFPSSEATKTEEGTPKEVEGGSERMVIDDEPKCIAEDM